MRLRTLIFLTVFGLAILPLLPLIAINLPGHISKHEQDAGQANLARAKIRFTELSEEIEQLQQSLVRLASLPTTKEAVAARAPQAGEELASLLPVWFGDDLMVEGIWFMDRDGTEVLGMSRGQGERLQPLLRTAPPEVLTAAGTQPAGPPGMLLNQEHLYFFASIPGPDAQRLGAAILQVDLPAMLQGYADAYWITPDGRSLHQEQPVKTAAISIQDTVFEEFPGLQTAISRSDNDPFIWDRQ